MKRPYDLLEKMRRSKAGCRPADIDRLDKGFGFVAEEGGDHTLYTHERYHDLQAAVARHRTLAIGYYSHAVRLVDEVRAREKREQEQARQDVEKKG